MSKQLERFRYYLGTAQIRLLNLCYSASASDPDDCVGCCISDVEHNLPALIGYFEYQNFLDEAGISKHALYAVGYPPRLVLSGDIQLPCLHSRFRLETAKRDRSRNQDDWWLVDLYSSDAPTSALAQIRQSYMRHVPLCDGEKFLHIQFHERKKDYEVALRWKKLLGAKVKSLHQVLRNDWLRDCLEKLEPFRSLWMGFQLGCFPLILSWRCSQEIEYYLNHMYEIWHTITDGNTHLCDEYTVEKLGGLAPLWSSRDRPIMLPLRELFPAGELFPSRDEFSLVSRRLPSVRDILLQHWYEQHEKNKQQCLLQYSEHDERFFECSDPEDMRTGNSSLQNGSLGLVILRVGLVLRLLKSLLYAIKIQIFHRFVFTCFKNDQIIRSLYLQKNSRQKFIPVKLAKRYLSLACLL
ncbi:hypothetical protein GGP41_004537 [Bipolaris sorokiniana]|uniref:Uncharacterized protein n=1 Tax=Cochliobolus sativus TaxID=45130 RepID=A0A8H5Z9A5_COCSA|nr:hypothetical protein GGP41_004537 [Bipolaris sorokiniana]